MRLQDADLVRRQAYIGGDWVDADSGLALAVSDPANGEIIAQVPNMGAAETRRAIELAEAAFRAADDTQQQRIARRARRLRGHG